MMRAGPGRKVKDLEMPITCTLFANSAADWCCQLLISRSDTLNLLSRGFFDEIPPRCRSRSGGGTKSVSAGAGVLAHPRTGARSSVSSSEAGEDNRKERFLGRFLPAQKAANKEQRTAESTNHAGKSRSPCHSGSAAVAGTKKGGRPKLPTFFFVRRDDYRMPCSTIDLATFMKPAMLAPFM